MDILYTIVGGVFIYFALWVVVFMVSIVRAPAMLDAEFQKEISRKEEMILSAKKELEHSKNDPSQEYYYRLAEEEISKWSDTCKQVVRHIYANEKLFAGPEIRGFPGLDSNVVTRCLSGELRNSKIVRRKESRERGIQIWWEIVPAYKLAITKLLYTDSNP
ncbi:MAG: hypothetical protein A3H27_12480 [Acidobacteria bacterium RIFCSPLOWO2_02_FULL_59_13]|nr:MAG: hypothetical protein A3H27_12480 [Acidobacteria bacterium RIFCSPLOWO2_02_FULL_59_13]